MLRLVPHLCHRKGRTVREFAFRYCNLGFPILGHFDLHKDRERRRAIELPTKPQVSTIELGNGHGLFRAASGHRTFGLIYRTREFSVIRFPRAIGNISDVSLPLPASVTVIVAFLWGGQDPTHGRLQSMVQS